MKKLTLPIVIVSAVSLLLIGLLSVVWVVGTYNGAATLRNSYEMKVKDNSSEFDNMWKKISQSTQIADSKKDAFKEIFTSYAQARTPQGAGRVMLWVKENAPKLNLEIFDNAQNIIVASRDGWTMRQKELVGIAEEYNRRLVTFPSNIMLGMFGFQKIDPKVVTSTRTEEAFSTGKDDDVTIKPK